MTTIDHKDEMPGGSSKADMPKAESDANTADMMPDDTVMPSGGMGEAAKDDEMPPGDMGDDMTADEMPASEGVFTTEHTDMPGGGMGADVSVDKGKRSDTAAAPDPLFPPCPDDIEAVMEFFARAETDTAYADFLESQCGASDDSQPVEQYDGTLGVSIPFVMTHQAPVGQLQWNDNLGSIYTNPGNVSGVRWCTGALISNDLFLSAGHCFDQTGGPWTRPKDNATGATITPAEIATNIHVNFNYQVDPDGNIRTEEGFPILELVEYRLGNLDFAIVRLGGNPGAKYGTSAVSTTDASEGEMVCIIGHPAGVPKRIEAGPVTDLHGDRIGYNDIDTLGGNSGSCILRASDGKIVGVHTHGGCTQSDPDPDPYHNHGFRITSIRAQSPTLQSLGASRSASGPAVAWGPKRLDVFVIGTNSSLYHKWWNGSKWGPSVTGYEYMGGKILGRPEVTAWGPNRLDVFVLGTNSSLYHKWWNGSKWGPSVTGYEYMGGKILGQPKVAAWGPNRLDVFVIGTNSSLYHKWWNGSKWGPSVTGYEHMGGTIISDPEVVSWGPNRLDVFVIGTNSSLYHKWWNGSAWGPSKTGYEFMGGKILGQPKVVAWGPNRLDVFATGTNSSLYHKWWNGSAWGPSVTGYENLGGTIISDPEVVAWGPNRLDIFAVGTNSKLYHKWWNGSAWGPSKTSWESLGGTIIGKPRVVSWGPNRLDIFVIGTDSALYHKWWNGSSWGPSKTGWQKMGGVIIDF